MKNKNLA